MQSGLLEQIDGSLWRPDWSWKPDKEVRQAIARGNRKWAEFERRRSDDYYEMRRLQREQRRDELDRLRQAELDMAEIMSGFGENDRRGEHHAFNRHSRTSGFM